MHAEQAFDGFQFNNEPLFDDQINAEVGVELPALVNHGQGHLTAVRNAAHLKFAAQTDLVNRLQQSWSQFTMYFDGSADHLVSPWVSIFHNCLLEMNHRGAET